MPVFSEQHLRRVWRILEYVVSGIAFASLDLSNFLANRNHGINKAIKLSQPFRLGWFNHQGTSHRKTHRRCMKPVVHQALGNIFGRDARGFFDIVHIKNTFVCHTTVATAVQHGIVSGQATRDIVGT